MPYSSASIYFGHAPDAAPTTYAPETDTFTLRLYPRGSFSHLVTIAVSGPDEQRRLLDALLPIVAELRRRLDLPSAA